MSPLSSFAPESVLVLLKPLKHLKDIRLLEIKCQPWLINMTKGQMSRSLIIKIIVFFQKVFYQFSQNMNVLNIKYNKMERPKVV